MRSFTANKFKVGDRVQVITSLQFAAATGLFVANGSAFQEWAEKEMKIRGVTRHGYTVSENSLYWFDDELQFAKIYENAVGAELLKQVSL